MNNLPIGTQVECIRAVLDGQSMRVCRGNKSTMQRLVRRIGDGCGKLYDLLFENVEAREPLVRLDYHALSMRGRNVKQVTTKYALNAIEAVYLNTVVHCRNGETPAMVLGILKEPWTVHKLVSLAKEEAAIGPPRWPLEQEGTVASVVVLGESMTVTRFAELARVSQQRMSDLLAHFSPEEILLKTSTRKGALQAIREAKEASKRR